MRLRHIASTAIVALVSVGSVSNAHAQVRTCTLTGGHWPFWDIRCETIPGICQDVSDCSGYDLIDPICDDYPGTGASSCRSRCSTYFSCSRDDDCPRYAGTTGTCRIWDSLFSPTGACEYRAAGITYCGDPGAVVYYGEISDCYRLPYDSSDRLVSNWFEGDCDNDGCPNGSDASPCVAGETCGSTQVLGWLCARPIGTVSFGSGRDGGAVADAGALDSSTPEPGAPDSSTPDSSAPDSGTVMRLDAAVMIDSSSPIDSGLVGAPDSGAADSGAATEGDAAPSDLDAAMLPPLDGAVLEDGATPGEMGDSGGVTWMMTSDSGLDGSANPAAPDAAASMDSSVFDGGELTEDDASKTDSAARVEPGAHQSNLVYHGGGGVLCAAGAAGRNSDSSRFEVLLLGLGLMLTLARSHRKARR